MTIACAMHYPVPVAECADCQEIIGVCDKIRADAGIPAPASPHPKSLAAHRDRRNDAIRDAVQRCMETKKPQKLPGGGTVTVEQPKSRWRHGFYGWCAAYTIAYGVFLLVEHLLKLWGH